MLRAGTEPKLIIDYPWDVEEFGPSDDRGRVLDHRRERPPEWTAVWLPNFLTSASLQLLGKLVRLDYILTGDTFDRLASHLSPSDRPAARIQLANEQSAVRERIIAALRQAYGVDPAQPGVVEERLTLSDQFLALDPGLPLQAPVGTSLRACFEGLADQLLRHRYPTHPEFTELVSRADLTHTLTQVGLALQQPNGRLENVEAPMRRVLTRVAGPLGLGTMYQAHFIADLGGWKDLVERRRAEAAVTTMTVGQGAPLARRRRHTDPAARPHPRGRRPGDPARRHRHRPGVGRRRPARRETRDRPCPRRVGAAGAGAAHHGGVARGLATGGGHGRGRHERVAVGNHGRRPRPADLQWCCRRPGPGGAGPRAPPRSRLCPPGPRRPGRPPPHRQGGSRPGGRAAPPARPRPRGARRLRGAHGCGGPGHLDRPGERGGRGAPADELGPDPPRR